MTQPSSPGGFKKWIRVLIGGLLSAGIATLIWQGESLLAYGFEEPLEIFATITGIWGGVIGVFVSWFLIGGVITFFAKKNLAAFGYWILFYVIMTIMGIM